MSLSPQTLQRALEAIRVLSEASPGLQGVGNSSLALQSSSIPHTALAQSSPGPSRSGHVVVDSTSAFKSLLNLSSSRKRSTSARMEVLEMMKKPKCRAANQKAEWKHRFVCLANCNTRTVPSSESDKDTLHKAGLGERVIEFPSLNVDADTFREIIYETFPKLRNGGGYQMCKSKANSSDLDPLSNMVYQSPALLKERCRSCKTYLVPLQQDLDTTPTTDSNTACFMTEKCLKCARVFPIDELLLHVEHCGSDSELSEEEFSDVHLQKSVKLEPNNISPKACCSSESRIPKQPQEGKGTVKNTGSVCLAELLAQLANGLDFGNPVRITVRRDCVWADALKEMQRKAISASSVLKVTFIGEPSIDAGGPRREFFRLLPLQAADTLLKGERRRFFTMNVKAFQQQEYRHLGMFTAMSIIQGGAGIPFLASAVYEYITNGKCVSVHIDPEDIPDYMLRNVVLNVIAADTTETIKEIFLEEMASILLSECGYVQSLQLKHRSDLLSALIDYHLMLKVKAGMDQFIEGLQEQGVLAAVRSSPSLFQSFFVFNEVQIDADLLRSVLQIDSSAAPERKESEEKAYFHFNIFIDECDDGKYNFIIPSSLVYTLLSLGCCAGSCSLEELLVFFTGSGSIPPQGFGKKCLVSFLHDSAARFPTASTCSMEIRIPTCHNDYGEFRDCMILGIKGCDGFGQI